jgi:phosphatidylglycerol:prolipoprotein diacylglycerol transferase
MNTLFIITTEHSSLLYSIFYLAAFLVSASIFIFQGFRNNYPTRTWLAIALFGIMCFIIGNKAITVNPALWRQFFHGQALPETGRSVLGGMLGLIAGLLIAQRWLKFNRPVMDHLAYALPAGIAITRLGCLFGGCCFGTPTNLPWAVQYGASSQAFHAHTELQQISATDVLSLPVHPTQLYDMLFCLVILLLVFLTRNRWKMSGSRFLFSILCYACFRFVEEFFREPALSGSLGETILGIKITQWMIIGAAGIVAFVLTCRELKSRSPSLPVRNSNSISPHREFLLFVTVPLFLVLTSGWLEPFEKLTLWFFMIPLILGYLHGLYHRMIIPELRWEAPLIILLAIVTMSQDMVDKEAKPVTPKYKGWFSVGAFGSLGSYPERHFDCNGNVTETIHRDYSTWGVGMAYHRKPQINHHMMVGVNAYSAIDRSDDPDETDYHSPAFNAFVSYDTRYVGANLGVNYFFDEYNIGKTTPAIALWAGAKDIFFGEFRLLTDYYLIGRPGFFQLGGGSGFGQVDKNIGRAGLCLEFDTPLFGESNVYVSGVYLAGDILINKKGTLKATLFIGRYVGGSLGFQVHLGKDRWNAKVNK